MIRNETLRKAIDAVNRHDTAAFAACYSPDAIVVDTAYPEPLRGRDAIARDMQEVISAFPDLRFEIAREIEAGDLLAVEYAMSGTHNGPLVWPGGHVPATGKSMKVAGAFFSRLDRGHVVEERRYLDFAGLLAQLGLLQ